MTVCIAALSNNGGAVVGASDRMITVQDVEFEPNQSKAQKLTPYAFLLVAGEAGVHVEMIEELRVRIEETGAPTIQELANMYADCYNELLIKRLNKAVLGPYGLDMDEFTSNSPMLASDLYHRLQADIAAYHIGGVQALISGVDSDGRAHIYQVNGCHVYCHDTLGFAAIGSGESHAMGYLMSCCHTLMRPVHQTAMSVYAAKRRAEVAPGIGAKTDMYVAYRKQDTNERIVTGFLPELIQGLDDVYCVHQRKLDEITESMLREAAALFESANQAT